ncbi:hypothetical protein ASF98_06940 [Arthrobacter sp. Leaf337]|uniref:hypothetical protein n=1 Tax=Arthrobacter sp. Leaf337 TaxID=1736342 RepID=UPI0006FD0B29|nr:hypothetical protein [Arthrobacter sp. Leaf337]KQR75542.1 hypothetical protein ASF98_06940 [Arthrobacter sp. Leaf337]
MRSFSRVSLVAVASAALIGSLALPASAADTTATVEVPVGSLSISAPVGADLATITPGSSASATLTGVEVIDTRAGEAGWAAQVVLSDFVGATPSNVIPATAAVYTPAVAVPTGTVTVDGTTQSDLSTPKTVQAATAVTGNNTATWDANLSVTAPADALADVYTATLTHSVL